jgi:hypothetical protein
MTSMDEAADKIENAAENIENEVTEPGDFSTNSASLFLVLGLLGISVSIVGLGAYNHYRRTATGLNHSLILTPGIYLLLGTAGGLSYLFYSSIYNEVGNASDTLSIMMKMSPVVYALYFLAAAIPAIEVYMHPRPQRF